MSDPQIFESLAAVQEMLAGHVEGVLREKAARLRERAAYYRQLALTTYDSVEEQARLEGMGDAFAIAAGMVEASRLKVVS